jgi:tRNA1(Val) A37 N6-methylase TrmN6
MTLYQPENGYCYNSDTLFLYDFISKFSIKGDVLEVGGGCGVMGLLLKRDFPKINLTFIEKQKVMYDFIHKNILENSSNAEVIHNNFLEYEFDKRYDFVVSNPPFYPSHNKKSENEIKSIARYDENLPKKEFFEKVNKVLKEQGQFIFCYDASRLDDIILSLPKPMKVTDIKFIFPNREKESTVVMIRVRKHAKSPIKFHPSIYSFIGLEYSEEAKVIYEKANTRSIKC